MLDNAPDHRALATQKKLAYLDFQCLDHLPYYPDLPLSVYNLFPLLKIHFKLCHFSSEMEDIADEEIWLDRQYSKVYFSGLHKLEQCAHKCLELREECVE